MHELQLLLVAEGLAPPLDRPQRLAAILSADADMEVYPDSIAGCDRVIYFLARSPYDKHMGLAYAADEPPPAVDNPALGHAKRYRRAPLRLTQNRTPVLFPTWRDPPIGRLQVWPS